MRHIDVTLTSRRRKFYCATDANFDAESSIHEKRYQQCSLFILSSMLRIFSPPSGRARIREIAERRSCKHVFPNTRIYLQRYTHVSTPTRHIFDFRMLSVCTYTHTHNCPLLRSLFSPTNIACISLECERVGQIYREKEGKRQSGYREKEKEEKEREREREREREQIMIERARERERLKRRKTKSKDESNLQATKKRNVR